LHIWRAILYTTRAAPHDGTLDALSHGRRRRAAPELRSRAPSAALAPAEPSQQDRNIAAVAGQMALEAATELARQSNAKAANPPGPITIEEETPRLSRSQTEGLRRYRGEETRSNQLLALI
jgi:hypothetical protein